ncbi:MAG: HD domain-containing protein [Endomicrobium sp.]|jgi:exopolyphosphatase/pppGpp-phosphohydrolase|nr:HD domain-containing protein [Endomicrobium sp.]
MNKMLTFDEIKNNSEIQTYLEFTDKASTMGEYKEHGVRHASRSAEVTGQILKDLGYNEKEQELAKIAAYIHDIGNVVGEEYHDQSSAVMFLNVLGKDRYNVDVLTVAVAIGCHEDKTTKPASPIAAALVLGDKSDVHHERTQVKDALINKADVRHEKIRTKYSRYINKHERILDACRKVSVVVRKEIMTIELRLEIDTSMSSVMDYFEIFMARMNHCRKASEVLRCKFELYINGDRCS